MQSSEHGTHHYTQLPTWERGERGERKTRSTLTYSFSSLVLHREHCAVNMSSNSVRLIGRSAAHNSWHEMNLLLLYLGEREAE